MSRYLLSCDYYSKETGCPLIRNMFSPVYFYEGDIIEVDVKGDSTTDFLRFHNQKTTKMNNNEMILKLPDEKSTVFVDNEILCITGSVFATISLPLSSGTYYSNGPMCEQKKEVLCCIDMETGETVIDQEFPKGNKVVYLDNEKYALYHEKQVDIYRLEGEELLEKASADFIEKNKKYFVELCGDRLFFYHEGKMEGYVQLSE